MQTQQAEHPDAKAISDTGSVPKTLWEQGYLAALLALVSGYVDAYAYLNYKVYVSFMSGNTTQTGLQLGESQLAAAGQSLLPIVAFVVGVFGGALLLHSRLHQPLRWLFAVCATLLVGSLVGARPGAVPNWSEIAILGAAMGAMNTSVAHVGKQSVGLGYVTGTLNNLAQHFALAIKNLPVPQAEGAWDTHGRRVALLASIWLAFLVGALLGAAAMPQFVLWTLLPPILVLVALAVFEHAKSDSA